MSHYYIPYLHETIEKIRASSGAGKIYLDSDIDRIFINFFGALWMPYSPYDSLLLIGARSGLEALLASYANSSCKIFVIEKDENLRNSLLEFKRNNIVCFSSLDSFLEKNEKIYSARIDMDSFSFEDTQKLLQNTEIHHLCGEIPEDSCDPLNLYRFLCAHVNSFYFWIAKNFSISGHRRKNIPEVSVIVAAYGVENYLDDCLQSLVNQTINNFEVIVVDDGSKDNSGKIADNWAHKYPDIIKVIHKINGGCASARQAGLEASKGEFIAFVDGDDLVEPQMYEDLFRAAALRNADIAQCGFYEFYPDQPRIYHSTSWGADGHGGISGLVYRPNEYLTLMPSIWRRIYNRDFLLRNNISFPQHIKRHDDLPFAFMTLARAKRISVIPDCYYAYRLNRPGQDVSATDERLFIHFEIFDWLYKKIRPWANFEVMNKLIELETGTHKWVIGRLDSHLKKDYANQVSIDMKKRYHNYELFKYLQSDLEHFFSLNCQT